MNLKALITLWNTTQEHPGTSGARACAAVLLALYSGSRFPLDLNELRRLDDTNLRAALEVIQHDLYVPIREVHEWLNRVASSTEFGARFEHLAYEHGFNKRRKKSMLPPLSSKRRVIEMSVAA